MPDIADARVLVIGAGSIGRRHGRNLRALGCQKLALCEPDAERRAIAAQELGAYAHPTLEEALGRFDPEVAFVCTPPSLHMAQALAVVRRGAHVFIEKPLSDSMDGVDELLDEVAARQVVVQVGYNLRFHAGLLRVHRLLQEGALGAARWLQAVFGQYLPDWRPAQDYSQGYSARRNLGGGILLDASHELDYATWLMGWPTELVCMSGRIGPLEVDVEDCATVLLRFQRGLQADVHVDFLRRGYTRTCTLLGDEATLTCDLATHEVRLYQAATQCWQMWAGNSDPNEMYVSEIRHFFACVRDGRAPVVSARRGAAVLELVCKAKQSAASRAMVTVPTWT